MKQRLIAWLLINILLLTGLVFILSRGLNLDSNVLDLLPQQATQQHEQAAIQQFTQRMSRQVIFLVASPQTKQAINAADQFAQSLKASQLFASMTIKVSSAQQQAWATLYFPYRLNLLSARDRQALKNHQAKRLVNQALFSLYSPAGIGSASLLATDPFFLFKNYLLSLANFTGQVSIVDQHLVIRQGAKSYVMLQAEIAGHSFSLSRQQSLTNTINNAAKHMQQQYPGVSLLKTGMVFYAKAGSDLAQKDISTIGVGSLLGIILLVVLTFYRLSPLLLILASAACGFMAALVITYLCFGQIYLFTLIFGASLLGIVVDYAFFYYADQLVGGNQWTASKGLRHVFSGISLGLLNVVIAFVIIGFTPFPGLQQLAVFAVSGLVMAYAFVVCVLPFCLSSRNLSRPPMLLRVSQTYLQLWQRLPRYVVMMICLLLLIFIMLGVFKLKANDDIHILQPIQPQLKHMEARIKQLTASHFGFRFLLVKAQSINDILDHEFKLQQLLRQAQPQVSVPVLAISNYLPSIKQQQENYQLIRQHLLKPHLAAYLQKLHMQAAKQAEITHRLLHTKFKPLDLSTWLQSSVAKPFHYLYLGKINQSYYSVMLVANQLTNKTLSAASKQVSNSVFVDQAASVSGVFGHFRQLLAMLVGVCVAILGLLMSLHYGIKRAVVYLVAPVFALGMSLALTAWLALPFTLFTVLGLVLVLGISVDYVLFFAEMRHNLQASMLAVVLSALTTMLSFGLLALSQTPAIAYFGLSILAGISTALLLSPIAARVSKDQT